MYKQCVTYTLQETAAVQSLSMDLGDYTPLHAAAMAISPNPVEAKRHITDGPRYWLNQRTVAKLGSNTALHIAAANVSVTEAFIQEFKGGNSLLLNSQHDTPYHVAARSSNQKAIIYLLNTFALSNDAWELPDMLINRPKERAINICARNGNAEAVELLLKRGADISKGLLHEIVIESVRHPKKTRELLGVYEKIVDNAVTWHHLKKKTSLPFNGSDDYVECFREKMITLLTEPMTDPVLRDKYGDRNVIECALEHGACEMFWRIINTKSVFRTDGTETCKRFLATNENNTKNPDGVKKISTNHYWTVFDVTDFAEETTLRTSVSDQKNMASRNTFEMTTKSCASTSNSAADKDKKGHSASEGAAKPNTVKSEAVHEPYLTHLLFAFDQWKNSNVLNTQPLKKLIEPYIALQQCLCFVLGLLQLAFMICFTAFNVPTTCSVARMFNVSSTLCNSSSSSDQRSAISDL